MSTRIQHLESSIKYRDYSYLRAYKAPLHLSRKLYKSTLFMQNKANLYHGFGARVSSLSVCNIRRYVNVHPVGLHENRPKNEPKRTQNEPNSYHGHPARGSSLSICGISRYVNVCPSGLSENERKNEPNFKPNSVKIGNLRRPTPSRNVFRFYSVFCVLCPVSFFVPIMTINCWQMFERSPNEDG